MSEVQKNRYATYDLHVNLVFITKYRKHIFSNTHHEYLNECVLEICKSFEAEIKEYEGGADYVRLLIQYPPTVQLTKLVNNLKSVTSRRMRDKFPELKEVYISPVLWSRSYFAGSCGGAPPDLAKLYIKEKKG